MGGRMIEQGMSNQLVGAVTRVGTKLGVALGAPTDPTYTGAGNASIESVLKGVYAILVGIESMMTANPATEGGNLLKTANALGTPADIAWSGTGSASAVSILKSINASLNSTSKIFKGTPATLIATTAAKTVVVPEGAARITIINTGSIDCQIQGASATQAGPLLAGFSYTIDCPVSGHLEAYAITVPAGGGIWYLVQQ